METFFNGDLFGCVPMVRMAECTDNASIPVLQAHMHPIVSLPYYVYGRASREPGCTARCIREELAVKEKNG